jgi:hypothetical protein
MYPEGSVPLFLGVMIQLPVERAVALLIDINGFLNGFKKKLPKGSKCP